MRDFLLELGLEEMPARFITRMEREFNHAFAQQFKQRRISHGELITLSTYRRLVVYVKDVHPKQKEVTELITGPPVSIAIDENGEFLPPGLGFVKRLGVESADLIQVEQNGKTVLAYNNFEKGAATSDILPDIITTVISGLSLPIAMRWADEKVPFIRPVQWICALYGTAVIPLDLWGVSSDKFSHGHRLLTNNRQIPIPEPKYYGVEIESSGKVLVDPKQRRAVIRNSVEQLSDRAISETLLEEVVNVTEFPEPLTGTFDSDYLQLPSEVLISSMVKHQRYFPIFNGDTLTNTFVVVAENVTSRNRSTIIHGNQRVLKARLDDAQFFWVEDLKKPLKNNLESLNRVTFQQGLGSMGDKVTRLETLSSWLTEQLGFQKDSETIQKVATLSKCDLTTLMVGEFPDLQGIMGAYYAEKGGESAAVAQGIRGHYLPKSQGDIIPTDPASIVVGIADRIDTIIACFVNNLLPSGSQDPYGVRRALFGIWSILIENKLSLNCDALIDFSYDLYGKGQLNKDKLTDFISTRLSSFFKEYALNYDVVNSLESQLRSNPYLGFGIAKELEGLRENNKSLLKDMVETSNRVGRLGQKAGSDSVDAKYFIEKIESDVFSELESIEPKVDHMLHSLELGSLFPLLSNLLPKMTNYFDSVLVMHEDENVQRNRLGFLKRCSVLFSKIADFEKIVLEEN